jgi:hypothetical protein
MKKLSLVLSVFTILSIAGVSWGEGASHRTKVVFEPHGESLCASGCALSRHPTPTLEKAHFLKLLRDFADQPMSEDSPALEELLYFGPQTERMLKEQDNALDSERRRFLVKELAKELVRVEFRIVDESGKVRVSLPPTTVPFDRRFVFEPLLTDEFQPPEASGTVKRVGLNHIWQRI